MTANCPISTKSLHDFNKVSPSLAKVFSLALHNAWGKPISSWASWVKILWEMPNSTTRHGQIEIGEAKSLVRPLSYRPHAFALFSDPSDRRGIVKMRRQKDRVNVYEFCIVYWGMRRSPIGTECREHFSIFSANTCARGRTQTFFGRGSHWAT